MIDLNRWREVSKDEFFKVIGSWNVHPSVIGRWGSPEYRSEFKTPSGIVKGISVPCCKYDGTPDKWYVSRASH